MKNVLLMILDGWGKTQKAEISAVENAHTPFMDSLRGQFPETELRTDGTFVGLPEGQMGNSEVGHMNIGAGRVVYQNLVRINKAIEDGSLAQNEVLQRAFAAARQPGRKLHFIGLVSDGGVHSHLRHLKALIHLAEKAGNEKVFVHAFTDGRDTDPHSGERFIGELETFLEKRKAKVASIVGRYFAMDRDQRWERVKVAWEALTQAQGKRRAEDPHIATCDAYGHKETDEFIQPTIITDEKGEPLAKVEPNDVVVCFNFRTDRCREITQALTQQDFPEQGMHKLPLHYVTMTEYDKNFEGVEVVFEDQDLANTLGETLAKAGKTQIRIAETEKYPHVTFFFNGGREEPFEGERRLLCPSPKVATYDLKPEMSAYEIRDKILPEIQTQSANFICLNFANPDMVGHTGDFQAAVKACEVVDECAGEVSRAALEAGYEIFIIADHGNAEQMKTPEGSPHTAHTTNPVPCFLLTDERDIQLRAGKLGDLAPTILQRMGVDIPAEMTGESLLEAQLA